MGYGSGRLPIERASKLGHVRLIENEHVTRLMRQFERVDATGDVPVGGLTGTVDLTMPTKLRFVVTVDGGQAVIPNEVRRDKRMGFIKVCAMIIRREDIAALREHPVTDPRELATIFDDGVWSQSAALPLAGIRLPGETVKETIRKTVDAVLEYTHLYQTLNFLVSRMWAPTYEMDPMKNPTAPHMDCLGCGASVFLPRNQISFKCAVCGCGHTLSDYLGIGEEAADDWAREEALMALRNVMETLAIFSTIINYWKSKPTVLAETLFLKDGPLLLRARLSRLVEPIRELVAAVRASGTPLFLAGIEKNGQLVDHIEDIKKHLTRPGDFFLPSVKYLYEEVAGLHFDPATYRNRVQYGSKIVVRVGPDHVVPLDIPTGEFLLAPTITDLYGFQDIAVLLSELTSYGHDNALIPIKLINDYSSISEHPSGDILKAFAGKLFGGS